MISTNAKLRFVFAASILTIAGTAAAQEARPDRAKGAGGQTARVANWLRQMDADKDGAIAADEATGLMKRFFQRNDADGDGKLSRKELAALSDRLARNANSDRGGANRNASRDQGMSDEQLSNRAPDGVTVETDIAYRPGDSKAWRLDLAHPAKPDGPKRPGIVFVHGGGWRSGDKRRGYFLQGMLDYAAKGYVCVTVNYRLTGEAPFPACIEDVKCAVRWLRANAGKYNLDPERIGAYGNSAGAHLVCMLGLAGKEAGLEGDGPHQDQSSLVQAVCASATPTDFDLFSNRARTNRTGRGNSRFGGGDGDPEELKRSCSPINHVSKDAPPFLLVHGTADETVNVKHSDAFVEALKTAGADDFKYIRIDGAGHGVFGQHSKKTHPAMEAFFQRVLKPGE